MPAKRYRFVPPGGGPDYNWTRDHTYVKVAAADSGGAYALMEDNLKREFALGLHLHRHHAETFYILDGVVNFHIDGDWMAAEPGSCVHIPPGVPLENEMVVATILTRNTTSSISATCRRGREALSRKRVGLPDRAAHVPSVAIRVRPTAGAVRKQ